MRRVSGGWVFDPGQESAVVQADSEERLLLAVAAHTRECCRTGHGCENGSRCERRCSDCHADRMAAWDGRKRDLSRQATAILDRADGIPVLPRPKVDPSLEKTVKLIVAVLVGVLGTIAQLQEISEHD